MPTSASLRSPTTFVPSARPSPQDTVYPPANITETTAQLSFKRAATPRSLLYTLPGGDPRMSLHSIKEHTACNSATCTFCRYNQMKGPFAPVDGPTAQHPSPRRHRFLISSPANCISRHANVLKAAQDVDACVSQHNARPCRVLYRELGLPTLRATGHCVEPASASASCCIHVQIPPTGHGLPSTAAERGTYTEPSCVCCQHRTFPARRPMQRARCSPRNVCRGALKQQKIRGEGEGDYAHRKQQALNNSLHSPHLDILDFKALDVQVIQPQQRDGISNLKPCIQKVRVKLRQ